MEKYRRLKEPSSSILFKDEVGQILTSIDRGEIQLPVNIPSNVRYGFLRTKLIASTIISDFLTPDTQQKQIDLLLAQFLATVVSEIGNRGYASDDIWNDIENCTIPLHCFVLSSSKKNLDKTKILQLRAISLIAELEHAISIDFEGLTLEERSSIPVIIADFVIEAQAALDTSLTLTANSENEGDVSFILDYYKQGIYWQDTVLEKDGASKQRNIKVAEQMDIVIDSFHKGASVTTGCWDALESTGCLPTDLKEAERAMEALRKQVNEVKRLGEKYFLNKSRSLRSYEQRLLSISVKK